MKYALIDPNGAILRRQDFDSTPPVLAPVKGLRWVPDNPPAYDHATQRPPRAIEPVLGDEVEYVVETITFEDLKAALIDKVTAATQGRLNAFTRTRNYDGILSACTYATSAVPKFAAEGQYCVAARDATWAQLYAIMAEVEAGTRPMPSSYAEIEPELPVLEWPQ